jgi:NAD(P)H dehydrogenase (quinone)
MRKKITIVLGHPDLGSYCASIASTYGRAARDAGHEVRLIDLARLNFDPVLHQGYKEIQPLEPGLAAVCAINDGLCQ